VTPIEEDWDTRVKHWGLGTSLENLKGEDPSGVSKKREFYNHTAMKQTSRHGARSEKASNGGTYGNQRIIGCRKRHNDVTKKKIHNKRKHESGEAYRKKKP